MKAEYAEKEFLAQALKSGKYLINGTLSVHFLHQKRINIRPKSIIHKFTQVPLIPDRVPLNGTMHSADPGEWEYRLTVITENASVCRRYTGRYYSEAISFFKGPFKS